MDRRAIDYFLDERVLSVRYALQIDLWAEYFQDAGESPVAYIEVCLQQQAQLNAPSCNSGSTVPTLPVT